MSRMLSMTVVLAAAALVAAACEGDDKPAYCSNVSDLQQSVDDLKNVQLKRAARSPPCRPISKRCRATQTRS